MRQKLGAITFFVLISGILMCLHAQDMRGYRLTDKWATEYGTPDGVFHSHTNYYYDSDSQTHIVSIYVTSDGGDTSSTCAYTETVWADSTKYDYIFGNPSWTPTTIITDSQGRIIYRTEYYGNYRMYYSTQTQPDSIYYFSNGHPPDYNNIKYFFTYDAMNRKQSLHKFTRQGNYWIDSGFYEYQYTSTIPLPHALDMISLAQGIRINFDYFGNVIFDATWPTSDIIFHPADGSPPYSSGWICEVIDGFVTYRMNEPNTAYVIIFKYSPNGLLVRYSKYAHEGVPDQCYGYAIDYVWGYVEPIANTDSFITPVDVSLEQNRPNPFNASTEIKFNLLKNEKVNLSIYNTKGQLIKTLVDSNVKAGNQSIVWNGDDNAGKRVSSGLYFYKLESAEKSQTRKLLLLK